MPLEWKRAVLDKLGTCSRRSWVSKCGQYKIEEHTKRLGDQPDLFLSMDWVPVAGSTVYAGYFAIISSHRTKHAAEMACNAVARLRERRRKK